MQTQTTTSDTTTTDKLDRARSGASDQPPALTLLDIHGAGNLRGYLPHKGPIPHTEHADAASDEVHHHKARAVTSEPQAIRTPQLPGCPAWTPEAASQDA
jgi:hypothetical protein